jgi:hypothetical protein
MRQSSEPYYRVIGGMPHLFPRWADYLSDYPMRLVAMLPATNI